MRKMNHNANKLSSWNIDVGLLSVGIYNFARNINVDGKKIHILTWSTTGQERFNLITSCYIKHFDGCFFIFDVTDIDSFKHLDNWIDLYKYNSQKKIMIILGNKADIKERVIKSEEAKNFAKERGLPYFETSSKTIQNINEDFETMVRMILISQNENYLKRSKSRFRLKYHNQKKVVKAGCCAWIILFI